MREKDRKRWSKRLRMAVLFSFDHCSIAFDGELFHLNDALEWCANIRNASNIQVFDSKWPKRSRIKTTTEKKKLQQNI